jgi:hypothetical protein
MRKNGVKRQLDMAAESAKQWPENKRREAKQLFDGLGESKGAREEIADLRRQYNILTYHPALLSMLNKVANNLDGAFSQEEKDCAGLFLIQVPKSEAMQGETIETILDVDANFKRSAYWAEAKSQG